MKNYSKYVKSRSGAMLPDTRYRDHSILNASASKYDCSINVDVSTTWLPVSVEKSENQDVRRTDIETNKMILASKVADLKSLHDDNMELPTEFDPALSTSNQVLVQKSAPQAPESSLASTDKRASNLKIVSRKVLSSDSVSIRHISKPERTEWSCSTVNTPQGAVDVIRLGLTWMVNRL